MRISFTSHETYTVAEAEIRKNEIRGIGALTLRHSRSPSGSIFSSTSISRASDYDSTFFPVASKWTNIHFRLLRTWASMNSSIKTSSPSGIANMYCRFHWMRSELNSSNASGKAAPFTSASAYP